MGHTTGGGPHHPRPESPSTIGCAAALVVLGALCLVGALFALSEKPKEPATRHNEELAALRRSLPAQPPKSNDEWLAWYNVQPEASQNFLPPEAPETDEEWVKWYRKTREARWNTPYDPESDRGRTLSSIARNARQEWGVLCTDRIREAQGLWQQKAGLIEQYERDEEQAAASRTGSYRRSQEDGRNGLILAVLLVIVGLWWWQSAAARQRRERLQQMQAQARERQLLLNMSPEEREVYVMQQRLDTERREAEAVQAASEVHAPAAPRQPGFLARMFSEENIIRAWKWHKTDQFLEAERDKAKAIREQTEELKRQRW